MFFEDVDFGWRMNLHGYDVRFVPTSLASPPSRCDQEVFVLSGAPFARAQCPPDDLQEFQR